MKFRIYLALPDRSLLSIYKVTRTTTGLYIASTMASPPGLPPEDRHLSYHQDGTCFDHSRGIRTRGRRQPLSTFTGHESLMLVNVIVYRADPREIVGRNKLTAADIVVEQPGRFNMEFILSDSLTTLPPLPGRPHPVVYSIDLRPRLLIEVWDDTETFGPMRYPSSGNWERRDLPRPQSSAP